MGGLLTDRLVMKIPIEKVREGDIIGASGVTLISDIIKISKNIPYNPSKDVLKWVTESLLSHSGVVVFDRRQHCLVVGEACAEGVVTSPLEKYCDPDPSIVQGVCLLRYPYLADSQAWSISRNFYKDCYGKEYDYPGLLGFLIRIILGKLGINIENPVQEREAWFCSEVIARLFRDIGVLLVPQQPESTSPEDLYTSTKLSRIV